MSTRLAMLGLAWLLAGGVATTAEATSTSSYSGSIGLGLSYDSNVAVLDLDESTGNSDLSALMEAGLAWQWRNAGGAGLRASYELWQTQRFELEDFDLRTHLLSLDGSARLGRSDVGLLLNRADTALDGTRYLLLNQVSPYLSWTSGNRLVIRLAYAWTDKKLPTDPRRDNRAQAVSVHAFVLLDDLYHYLLLGAQLDEESAAAREFDYRGQRLSAQWVRHVPAGDRDVRLRAGLRYEGRRYAAPLLPVDPARHDSRYRLETRLDVPVWGPLSANARYEYADSRSTLPAAAFSEHLVSFSLRAEF